MGEEPRQEEQPQPPAGGATPPPPEPVAETPAEPPAAAQPTAEAAPAARPERPARAEREAKAPEKQPPPPGSIADVIRGVLPDLQFEAYQGMTDVMVEIGRDDVAKVMPVLKNDPRLDLKFLRCLFGVDYLAEGIDVVYQLMSLEKGHEVVVKTRLPRDNLKVASVESVWRAANWHERETRDMFGIEFEGHPHLVPLLLPEDMTDHFPLRKDSELAPIEESQFELVPEGAAASTDAATEE